MKNTNTSNLNINIFKAALKHSIESAFETLSDEIGDNLFHFERLQLSKNEHSEELMDKLAANLDKLFANQMNVMTNKINKEIDQYIHLQKNLYKQNFSEKKL